MEYLLKFFQGGGAFMYPIAVLLILGTIIIVERIYMIMFHYTTNSSQLMHKVQEQIVDNNIGEALNICNAVKETTVGQVFRAALLNADRTPEELQDHIEVATLSSVPKLQNRVPYLFTIANVATLLGLLGTIMGLIQTFEAVGAVDASQKQQLLSAGISTAMSTTAFGLIVAIPCMLTYGFLYNKINSMVDEVDHYSSRLLILLRTGSQYFEQFNPEEIISTKQEPKEKGAVQPESETKDKKAA